MLVPVKFPSMGWSPARTCSSVGIAIPPGVASAWRSSCQRDGSKRHGFYTWRLWLRPTCAWQVVSNALVDFSFVFHPPRPRRSIQERWAFLEVGESRCWQVIWNDWNLPPGGICFTFCSQLWHGMMVQIDRWSSMAWMMNPLRREQLSATDWGMGIHNAVRSFQKKMMPIKPILLHAMYVNV